MTTDIAIAAEEILRFLDKEKGAVDVLKVQFNVDQPLDMVNLGIGWLIREGRICVLGDEEKYLALLPKEMALQEAVGH